MTTKVYFDLDGVLSDWVKAFEFMTGIPVDEFAKMSKEQRLAIKEEHVRADFFRNLEPIEHGLDMFRVFNRLANVDVEILTAVGDVEPFGVITAKIDWVREYLCPHVKINTVHKSKDKAVWATKGAVLIDDRDDALIPWREAGGIGWKFI